MINNFGEQTAKHADKVLDAMREAMGKVPKEKHSQVLAVVYRRLGQAHYGIKS